jgi:hypothetical protein
MIVVRRVVESTVTAHLIVNILAAILSFVFFLFAIYQEQLFRN